MGIYPGGNKTALCGTKHSWWVKQCDDYTVCFLCFQTYSGIGIIVLV